MTRFCFPILTIFFLCAPARAVSLNWLDSSTPPTDQGVSFGVPWPVGLVKDASSFSLTAATHQSIPIQSWPLAYWPDGSLKWTGHAISTPTYLAGPFQLVPSPPSAKPNPIAHSDDDSITINTGTMVCRIPTSGKYLIDTITLAGRTVASHGQLIASLEDRSLLDTQQTLRYIDFTSEIKSVTLEQSGPVRAVVKITGVHKSQDREFLPFIVRLYFYNGIASIRMVHTFLFDGDQEKDFIRSLGVRFTVPLREETQNRHVRLAGDTGFLAEPVQLLVGRRNPSPQFFQDQIAGKRVPNLAELKQLPHGDSVADMAVWDSYKLDQLSDGGYTIQKCTNPNSAWISVTAGHHSNGLAFVGDVSGGLALSLQNFWQLTPTEFEIQGAGSAEANLTLYLWSPDSPAMDLRHYDTKSHGLDASYEDIQPGMSTPEGIARTSVVMIRPYAAVPSDDDLWHAAQADQNPPLLVCPPDYYHDLKVFGLWSLPNPTGQFRTWIENELDTALTFYQSQIAQRHWYGFWDFGDVIHTYDSTRHEWRYDVGGQAWSNTELMPNLWLWYSFLRTGRSDIFRMAEAMTRQTQEVDVYHFGPLQGLGSRHNVRHWGDGAKEVRISQAILKRPYYYLTTDERTGDLMNEVINVDQRLVTVDPLREVEPKTTYPTHIRVGPDWFACVGNWYTAYERTSDPKYLAYINAGRQSLEAMPHGLFSGGPGASFGYDPKTHKLYQIHNEPGIEALAGYFGGPELNFEMNPVLNDPAWNKIWLDYCQYVSAPPAEQLKFIGVKIDTSRGTDFARLPAYAAYITKNPTLASRAWQQFLHGGNSGGNYSVIIAADPFASHRLTGPDVPEPLDEITNISTNATAQWSLNAIELLELVGDHLPTN